MAIVDMTGRFSSQQDRNRSDRINLEHFPSWSIHADHREGDTSSSLQGISNNPTQPSFYHAQLHTSPNTTTKTATAPSPNDVQTNWGAAFPLRADLYADPNPQIIIKEAQEGPITYQQNVFLRYLKPPPPPPPGPLIIKEVRVSQPPPPPPLVVRQHAEPLPPLPPLILRECPPKPPPTVPTQTVICELPAIPPPPRSVILERVPTLPPKPRDIIIERWIPYGPPPKRPTIVQRASPPVSYPPPRNSIVMYDPVPVRIVRNFQRLDTVQEDPQSYLSRYGPSLLNPTTLIQQARAAGVVEDLSLPSRTPRVSCHSSTSGENALFSLTSSQGFFPSIPATH